MPKSVPDAKIALINSAIEVKKTEVDAKIQITDPNMLSQFLDEEEQFLRSLVDKISESGANTVICQKGIDDLAQHYMAKAGIFAIRRAKKSDMEALSKATGGRIVNNLDDLSGEDLGSASKVEERKIGDSDMVFVEGCPQAKSVSVLLGEERSTWSTRSSEHSRTPSESSQSPTRTAQFSLVEGRSSLH